MMSEFRADERTSGIGGVDMQPNVISAVTVTDIAQFTNIVKRTYGSRAKCRTDLKNIKFIVT
jgi:hypothetical protein